MYDIPGDLSDAFKAAPAVFLALLEGCTQEKASATRGGDENWSVVEVMCHLRDAEERALERMRAMRDADRPFLPGYDQDEWARERTYAEADLRETLTAFLRFREAHIADLEALSPDDWQRPGTHEERGEINIWSHTLHMVSHDMSHAAQIARQLAGG